MLAVSLLCMGKLKEAYWRDACAEYAKRLSAFCRFSVVELPEARLPENPSQAEIAKALQAEGERLLESAGNAHIIALCVEGAQLSSPQLARHLESAAVGGVSAVCYVVGSSFGLAESVKARAALRLSMSPMTFPHQLARVMLCEQTYRAFQINQNGKYHK